MVGDDEGALVGEAVVGLAVGLAVGAAVAKQHVTGHRTDISPAVMGLVQ